MESSKVQTGREKKRRAVGVHVLISKGGKKRGNREFLGPIGCHLPREEALQGAIQGRRERETYGGIDSIRTVMKCH